MSDANTQREPTEPNERDLIAKARQMVAGDDSATRMTSPTVDARELEQFFDRLRDSNLLDEKDWQRVHDAADGDGAANLQTVARRLVQDKLITAWQARMLLSGRKAFFLGKYKLLEQLGQGGMGSVLKAEQTPIGRIVAIKVMSKRLVKDEQAVARFHREIEAAAALDHPNIVHAYDADAVGDNHFLVMEYVDGEDLGAIAKRMDRLPIGLACELMRQAALGLQHAHERGMVHRDIKPSNLLLLVKSQETRDESGRVESRESRAGILTLNPQPSTLNPQLSTLNQSSKSSTWVSPALPARRRRPDI